MAQQGLTKNLHHKHRFVVEIDGFKSAAFSECSGIEWTVGVVKHREGGAVLANKSPGLVEVTPIVLKRGVSSDIDCFLWMTSVVAMAAAGVGAKGVGLADGKYKRNGDIVQLDNDGTELRRWTFRGAWPTKFKAAEWDNSKEEVQIEELTLEYDFPDITA